MSKNSINPDARSAEARGGAAAAAGAHAGGGQDTSVYTPSAEDLRIFIRVALLGSFTQAAEQLRLPRATVSTAVLRLEKRLGARLLQRTTRRVGLTGDGRAFLDRCAPVLDDLEDLGGFFQRPDGPLDGRLRVGAPLGMAAGPLMARLPEFLARHPALRMEVSSSDRRADMIGEGLDCVIRVGAVADESLACRPLGVLPLGNFASRGYLRVHGRPRGPGDLARHWLVDYRPNPSDGPAAFEYRDAAGRVVRVPMQSRVTVDNSAAYDAACRAGLGLIQAPLASAARAPALVGILPDCPPPPMPVNLLFPHHRHLPRRVRVFADWVAGVLNP
ncbi:LysR family transcriptional regulator [Castellaniella defragrans]|uniref:DNA-binding transcriptional LysR family regulator n=1 Tax=Castellaniella defragrans TaxID=75697 RepID=A0A7W9WNY4_CASDE|nr:LysR family transcriptional regulator [Castellaniella defragrans]KAB0615106.1 LysR family transcriptional regulator [Castellaniella defragrans]MBB6083899.1 DNA-binding transcriptional LysR family regulator [Castellaniella defragrans]